MSCDKMVGKGIQAYQCDLAPHEGKGPCMTPSIRATVLERQRYEADPAAWDAEQVAFKNRAQASRNEAIGKLPYTEVPLNALDPTGQHKEGIPRPPHPRQHVRCEKCLAEYVYEEKASHVCDPAIARNTDTEAFVNQDYNPGVRVILAEEAESFRRELARLLNKCSYDNEVGIPDFILAAYLFSQLMALKELVAQDRQFHRKPVEAIILMAGTVVVDGNNILSRAQHASDHTKMTDNEGNNTGGIVIFANMISRFIAELEPEAMVVVWDAGGQSFRHALFPGYKANRASHVGGLDSWTMGTAKAFLGLCGITQVQRHGVEADDVIAWYARKREPTPDISSNTLVIVSADKDFYQLINPVVHVYDPLKLMWDYERFLREFGIPPQYFGWVLAVAGDAVDGIDGVPRIGVKTAIAILNKYERNLALAMADPRLEPYRELIDRNLALTDLSTEAVKLDLGHLSMLKMTAQGDLMWLHLMEFLERRQMTQLAERFISGNFGKNNKPGRQMRRDQLSLAPM